MHPQSLLYTLLALPVGSTAETVLGVYLFSRHGDRTAKAVGSTRLTDLGYQEVFTSGNFYRNRYVSSNASSPILGISSDLPQFSQIAASAPYDAVLMPSAQGFLQGMYPPVGMNLGSEKLRNGTSIETPLNGYQIVPIQTVSTGTNSENSAWLQGQTNCANAAASSNQYLSSNEYNSLFKSTQSFYQNFTDLTNGTFPQAQMNFKMAYSIFDLFNVAEIHNSSFDPQNVLGSNDNFFQLRTLADQHEWNLAYNSSEPIRAVAGATLAAQVVQALNKTIATSGANKFNIQFGAYGSFQSFFGLANLTAASPDFYGIPDYASSMVFELVTNSSTSPFPAASDISVRFYFHNGTTSNKSTPAIFPLFGQQNTLLSWNDFVTGMNKFAIGSQSDWCKACGNTTGVCAPGGDNATSASSASNDTNKGSGSHLSNAVAGVIGAMVTLGVILGLELLAMLIGGFRLVSKKRLANGQNGSAGKA